MLALAGCSNAEQPATLAFEAAGRLEDPQIREASGLARSQRESGVLWIANDSGSREILYALDHTGASLGRTELKKASNKDWEDLASFELDGEPYLMVADIGDNLGRRKSRKLYFLKEPKAGKKSTTVDWEVSFRYPDGPRDAEAAAVDTENERVLILSKRDIPPVLYEVPLQSEDDKKVTAKWLGTIESLPKPSRQDVEFAPRTKDWHWQPAAMDISQDNRAAVILTYRAVYYFLRRPGQDWYDAFNTKPIRISLGNFVNAEAVAFADDHRTVMVTGENRNALLLRVDLGMPGEPAEPTDDAVTVMAFNVQNLFDNTDDPGKDDKAYLPVGAKQSDTHIAACNEIPVESWRDECLYLDWSDAALEFKLGVLAKTIRQVNDGRGADVIALQEVENIALLERLRTEFLEDLGYLPAILIEGTDTRGIDVAFLSKLPLVGDPTLHPLHLPDFPDREGDTRGVLQADFAMPDGSVLTGFSVHFPAPFHPTPMRVAAYEHLNQLRAALPDDHHVFAAGDFNTTSTEDERERMLDRFARPAWTLAHDIGCADCKGTAYYSRDKTWSFLDMILFSPARGEKTTARIRADSVAIANRNPSQVSSEGTPERFRSAARTGVSDHWPIIATVELTEKQ
ncbi:MAG: endonuclease/exonuclease/phosphatase family protein [Gammaproteobacteria bacterium]|nr:endonuclease/exonuclease/phosphatase family protein [Gammaproteobacteria bacterium]